MKLLNIMLTLLALLLGSAAASAQDYDPTSPPEPGVPNPEIRRTLTTRCVPEGAGNITSSGDYIVGNTVSIYANPNSGYQFVQWEDADGNLYSETSSFELTMPRQDVTLIARFVFNPSSPFEPPAPNTNPKAKVFLKSSPEDVCTFNYASGAKIEIGKTETFLAFPKEYYNFVSWTKDGVVISESQELVYTIQEGDQTLVANFVYNFDPSSPSEPTPPTPSDVVTGIVSSPRITMYDDTHVQILTETQGATVYYTIDGTTPTTDSPVYTGPVYVPNNLLVKAFAVKDGLTDSSITSYQVTAYTVATPKFTFVNRMIEISSDTPGATIHYTLDFADPDQSSPVYSTPIEPVENFLIKAYAVKEGLTDSKMNIFIYFRNDYLIDAPTFSLNEEGQLVIHPSVSGGTTYYTMDGTEPSTSSSVYSEPITLDHNCTVKAYTTHTNYFDSPVSSYEVTGFQLPIPTATFANLRLTLSCDDSLAQIYYTTDGTTPTNASTLYESPIALTADCTVQFIAIRENYVDSEIGSYTFVRTDHQAAQPLLSFDSSTNVVTLSTSTENAEIRYTLDDTVPTSTTGNLYSEPFFVDHNCNVTAVACRSDLFDSEPIAYAVTNWTAPIPIASVVNKALVLTCEDTLASIYYATDVNTAFEDYALYEGPIALNDDCFFIFYSTRENFNNSVTSTFQFNKADYQAAAPAISFDAESSIVSITTATENAEIRYTLDGTVPTATSGTVYTEPFSVEGNLTVKAIALRSDLFDSEVTTYVISDRKLPTPTASFANKLLILSCEDTEAQIHYTTDGSNPTAESALYESPIALTADCTVKFIATRENFNDSEIATFEFVKANYQAAAPAISFDADSEYVTIRTATEGAEIHYTLDGTVPTAETGTVFSEPFTINGNMTVTAVAFRSDLFDSEASTYVISDRKLPTPTANFANKLLTLACEDTEAQIHYTTDGSNPTAESTLYESPIALTADCTVKFIATREKYTDSEVATFEFYIANYQVTAPNINYDSDRKTVTISVYDEGAEIHYTTDGSDPSATDGNVYSEPFKIEGRTLIKAIATLDSLFDSKISSAEYGKDKLPTPTASYSKKHLILSCEDPEAGIWYQISNNVARSMGQWGRYSEPIDLTEDCTVKFYASRENFIDSETASFSFVKADYQEAKPIFVNDYRGRTVTINQADNLNVTVVIDGDSAEYATPAKFNVTPATKHISAVVIASDPDRFDSDTAEEDIEFHLAPQLSLNDGHIVRADFNQNEAMSRFADIIVKFNDTEADNEISISDFGYATAHVESNHAFRSEESHLTVDCFYNYFYDINENVSKAGVRNGHRLAEAFEGNETDGIFDLYIVGELNREDIELLATFRNLPILRLMPDSLAEEDYSGALAGASAKSILLKEIPEGILVDMPRLTNVVWVNHESAMPDGILTEIGNPNLLFWTADAETVPTDASNVVTYTVSEDGFPDLGYLGTADRIVLTTGYPFSTYSHIMAENIELTKDFNQQTEINISRGWETLILPFVPQTIRHETKGDIITYAEWEKKELDDNGPKPFWLYEATPDGWEAAETLRAFVPYIISMPNCQDYVPSYILGGKVTFSAKEVMLDDMMAESGPFVSDWIDGTRLTGTFMPVEENHLSLNNEWEDTVDDILPGSLFTEDAETLPFEAYVAGHGSLRSLPVFPGGTGIELPAIDLSSGIFAEAIGQGRMRIISSRNRTADLYTPTGVRICSVKLNAGEPAIVDDLAPGIYLVAGQKIMIK